MSIRITIDDNLFQRDLIAESSKRVRELEIVAKASAATGRITENVSEAIHRAEEGDHVLLIAPFRVPSEKVSQLEAANRIAPALLARCTPSVRQIKYEIDTGRLGEIGLLRSHRWDASRPLDDQRLAEQLDIATWLMGSRPKRVYAVERDDYVQMHLGWEGDHMAIMDVDAHVSIGRPYESLHLIGSRGAAYADDHRNMQLSLHESGITAIPTTQGDVAWVNLLEWFCESVREKSDLDEYWKQVTDVTRSLRSVRRSMDLRRPVDVGVNHE